VFEGFKLEYLDVGEVTLRVRHGGARQPVVLQHGHPRTHTTWHLAEGSHPGGECFCRLNRPGVRLRYGDVAEARGTRCVVLEDGRIPRAFGYRLLTWRSPSAQTFRRPAGS
jgi:hypothetical protein